MVVVQKETCWFGNGDEKKKPLFSQKGSCQHRYINCKLLDHPNNGPFICLVWFWHDKRLLVINKFWQWSRKRGALHSNHVCWNIRRLCWKARDKAQTHISWAALSVRVQFRLEQCLAAFNRNRLCSAIFHKLLTKQNCPITQAADVLWKLPTQGKTVAFEVEVFNPNGPWYVHHAFHNEWGDLVCVHNCVTNKDVWFRLPCTQNAQYSSACQAADCEQASHTAGFWNWYKNWVRVTCYPGLTSTSWDRDKLIW